MNKNLIRMRDKAFQDGCLAGMQMMGYVLLVAMWNEYAQEPEPLTLSQLSAFCKRLEPELNRQREMIGQKDYDELLIHYVEEIRAELGMED